MSEPVRKFMASDAMAYVDTYRRLVMSTPGDITASKERLEAKMREMNMVPPRLYAERCAHDHALNFVQKRLDPGMVTLGEAADQTDTTDSTSTAAQEQHQLLEDELAGLRRQLKQAAQHAHELEADLVVKSQELGRLHRKLAQTYNSVAVGGVAVIVVLLVLFGLLAFRGS